MINKKANTGKCCLCKNNYTHYGNNPYPLKRDTDKKPNRCCDNCNYTKVLPERFKRMKEEQKNTNKNKKQLKDEK